MKKIFGKAISLSLLFMFNLSVLMWLASYLSSGNFLAAQGLIGSVHAETAPAARPAETARPVAIAVSIPDKKASAAAPAKPDATPARQPPIPAVRYSQRHVVLRFNPMHTNLSQEESQRLSEMLATWNIGKSDPVIVTSAPASLEKNNTVTIQTAKLRVQSIARAIFPYSQNLTIQLQHPALEVGTVLVEFPANTPAEPRV
jgi:hypothetical protein